MDISLYAKVKDKGLSQAALARKIGITPRSLCNKFKGNQPFLYREVVAICKELDIQNPLDHKWEEKGK